MDVDTAKKLAASDNRETRRQVALESEWNSEIHAFLANDAEASVRHALAYNPHLDPQAGLILAKDHKEKIRLCLAQTIADKISSAETSERESFKKITYMIAENLSQDLSLKVRKALSQNLRTLTDLPQDLALALSLDEERSVSEPMLIHSQALTDEDLLHLLRDRPEDWVQLAMAHRQNLSEPLCDKILYSNDTMSIGVLLDNETANIASETLERIVEQAIYTPVYQSPLARRPQMPERLLVRLSEFIDLSLSSALSSRKDLNEQTSDRILSNLSQRQETLNHLKSLQEYDADAIADKVKELHRANLLNHAVIMDAIEIRKFLFLKHALAHLSGLGFEKITHIIDCKDPRHLCTLSWKCGLPAYACVQLQKSLYHLPEAEILYPKNRHSYPLADVEMERILKLYN